MPPQPDDATADETASLGLMASVARLLFVSGQTTEQTKLAVDRLARASASGVQLLVRWGELLLLRADGAPARVIQADPLGVDMRRVAAVEHVVDGVFEGRLDVARAAPLVARIAAEPPVSALRFIVMAAVGAVALGIIFGTSDPATLALIAVSAAIGGWVRRVMAARSSNPLVQPFAAALVAGLIGGIAIRLGLPVVRHLVIACPCMVLVPGPHFLNGTIDLARARMPIGAARIAFATLVVLMICTGLLAGLAILDAAVPEAPAQPVVPFLVDVVAAGAAVAAYGSFFNMPWRTLPFPIVIGMTAHAVRWVALRQGMSVELGAFVACLLVGLVVSPLADRIRMPFAGFAFASVVSMIPGVLVFQLASDLLALVHSGTAMPEALVVAAVREATTAFLILLAMTLGLAVPRLCWRWEHVRRRG